MKAQLIASAALLSLAAQPCFARASEQFGASSPFATSPSATAEPNAGQGIFTSHGGVFTTGRIGNMQTTTLPGNGGVGLLMNNGNGTSTLTEPGGVPMTVPTPR
jgi:hypothetical protein